MKNLFIVFEGPDGAGLSTQSRLLENWFSSQGKNVLVTKEPTNNPIGKIVRSVLKKEIEVDMNTFALLFAADRAHHIHTQIKPALEKGSSVVCDRYILCTLAFQSMKSDLEWLKQLNSKFPKPDLTFVLDLPGQVCVKRIERSRPEKEFFETIEKLDKARENYRKLKNHFPNTFIIDGTKRIEQIHNKIVGIVEKHFR